MKDEEFWELQAHKKVEKPVEVIETNIKEDELPTETTPQTESEVETVEKKAKATKRTGKKK